MTQHNKSVFRITFDSYDIPCSYSLRDKVKTHALLTSVCPSICLSVCLSEHPSGGSGGEPAAGTMVTALLCLQRKQGHHQHTTQPVQLSCQLCSAVRTTLFTTRGNNLLLLYDYLGLTISDLSESLKMILCMSSLCMNAEDVIIPRDLQNMPTNAYLVHRDSF